MKNKRLYQLTVATFSFLLYIIPFAADAQKKSLHDSNYFTTFPNKLTTRFYFSKKYSSVMFPALRKENDLQYSANTNLTMGVGATYNNLSLNLSYGFGFINPDKEKGKTKSIDLEVHVYPNKWAIDLLAIQHRGLHIEPKGYAAVNADNYYYRPDARMTLAGLGIYRVINSNKFSYNAAMIQSAWQKKSAGSFMYGGEVYYGSLKADSSLVPKVKENLLAQAGINKMQFFTAGAGIGYAYTLVLKEHFYAMGSLITNLDIHFSNEHNNNIQQKKTSVTPSFNYKTAIGYNSDDWSLSANWTANALMVKGRASSEAYLIPTGNYRVILAKRIGLKRK